MNEREEGQKKKSLGQAPHAMSEIASYELWQLSLVLAEIAKQEAKIGGNSADNQSNSKAKKECGNHGT